MPFRVGFPAGSGDLCDEPEPGAASFEEVTQISYPGYWRNPVCLTLVAACLALGVAWILASHLRDRHFHFDDERVYVPQNVPGTQAVCTIPDRPHFVRQDGSIPPARRIRRFRYTINLFRYRGPEPVPMTHDGSVGVACVGTGVTFGIGVDDNETYPFLLQGRLNQLAADGAVRVLNLGFPGRCLDEVPRALNLRWMKSKEPYCHVVIVCCGVNDALPMFGRRRSGWAQAVSAIASWHRRTGKPLLLATEPASSFHPWRAVYDEFLSTLKALAERLGLPVVDLHQAMAEREERDGLILVNEYGAQQVVRTHGAERTILFETRYSPARGEQPISPAVYEWLDTHDVNHSYFIDGVHLNARGHRAVSEILASRLVALLGTDLKEWRDLSRHAGTAATRDAKE